MMTLSMRQLAKILGVSHSFLSQVRNGKRPLPEHLRKRTEALGAHHSLTASNQEYNSTDQSNNRGPVAQLGQSIGLLSRGPTVRVQSPVEP